MNRSSALRALLSIVAVGGAVSTARADNGRIVEYRGGFAREHRLPLCYGNNFQFDTMLRPGGFTSLECVPLVLGQTYCDWRILSTGTRPTHSYVVRARASFPPPPPTPPMPPPPESIVAAAPMMSRAAGPRPSPAPLAWPTGTVIAGFWSSTCRPAPSEDHDRASGAILYPSREDGLVFALDGGRNQAAVAVEAESIGEVEGCDGRIAIQVESSGQWLDTAFMDVYRGGTSYHLNSLVAPGQRVRLALRSTEAACTLRKASIYVPIP